VVVDGPGGRLGESIEVGNVNVNIYSIKEFQVLPPRPQSTQACTQRIFFVSFRFFPFLSLLFSFGTLLILSSQKLVRDNDINVLMCLFLPREMKWKEEIPFGDEECFRLKLPHLKKSVCAEATRTWKKAALLWNSGDSAFFFFFTLPLSLSLSLSLSLFSFSLFLSLSLSLSFSLFLSLSLSLSLFLSLYFEPNTS